MESFVLGIQSQSSGNHTRAQQLQLWKQQKQQHQKQNQENSTGVKKQQQQKRLIKAITAITATANKQKAKPTSISNSNATTATNTTTTTPSVLTALSSNNVNKRQRQQQEENINIVQLGSKANHKKRKMSMANIPIPTTAGTTLPTTTTTAVTKSTTTTTTRTATSKPAQSSSSNSAPASVSGSSSISVAPVQIQSKVISVAAPRSPVSPVVSSISRPHFTPLQQMRLSIEKWRISRMDKLSSSYVPPIPSTPTRAHLAHCSPAFVSHLTTLSNLIKAGNYHASLTQLHSISTLFPVHRVSAEYYLFKAYILERTQQPDSVILAVWEAAMENQAEPVMDIVNGFKGFEKRREQQQQQENTGTQSSSSSSSTTTITAATVVAPSTPMQSLLNKYRSMGSTPSAAPGAVNFNAHSTPISNAFRSIMVLDSPELKQEEKEMIASSSSTSSIVQSSKVNPTPRSERIRGMRLTPDSDECINKPATSNIETIIQSVNAPATPLFARNLMNDLSAEEQHATPSAASTLNITSDALSPLQPLQFPSSSSSASAMTDGASNEANNAADSSDDSSIIEDNEAEYFDDEEFVPGLSTPYTENSSNTAILSNHEEEKQMEIAEETVEESPSSSSSPSAPFVSPAPLRRSCRLSSRSAKPVADPENIKTANNNNIDSDTDRQEAATEQESTAINLTITVDEIQTEDNSMNDSKPAVVSRRSRNGTPALAPRRRVDCLPPAPIRDPSIIVVEPIRSTSSVSSAAFFAAASPRSSAAGSSLSSAAFSQSSASFILSPVRRSTRHATFSSFPDFTLMLGGENVEYRMNNALGPLTEEWPNNVESNTAANTTTQPDNSMPPPAARLSRKKKTEMVANNTTSTTATTPIANVAMNNNHSHNSSAPSPAAAFDGVKRHCTPRPGATRRSTRLSTTPSQQEDSNQPTSTRRTRRSPRLSTRN